MRRKWVPRVERLVTCVLSDGSAHGRLTIFPGVCPHANLKCPAWREINITDTLEMCHLIVPRYGNR